MSLHTFSRNLRHLRKQRKLTQHQLAKGLFISRSVVAKMETGVYSPKLSLMERTCKLFNIDFETITGKDLAA